MRSGGPMACAGPIEGGDPMGGRDPMGPTSLCRGRAAQASVHRMKMWIGWVAPNTGHRMRVMALNTTVR